MPRQVAACKVASACRLRRGRWDPGLPSPGDTSDPSFYGSDSDLPVVLAALLKADLVPSRGQGGFCGRRARGV
jgi:hypothetical protein